MLRAEPPGAPPSPATPVLITAEATGPARPLHTALPAPAARAHGLRDRVRRPSAETEAPAIAAGAAATPRATRTLGARGPLIARPPAARGAIIARARPGPETVLGRPIDPRRVPGRPQGAAA